MKETLEEMSNGRAISLAELKNLNPKDIFIICPSCFSPLDLDSAVLDKEGSPYCSSKCLIEFQEHLDYVNKEFNHQDTEEVIIVPEIEDDEDIDDEEDEEDDDEFEDAEELETHQYKLYFASYSFVN
jgi:hypothetical protein